MKSIEPTHGGKGNPQFGGTRRSWDYLNLALWPANACLNFLLCGAVAQLVERVVRNDEAVSSNLIGSTSRFVL